MAAVSTVSQSAAAACGADKSWMKRSQPAATGLLRERRERQEDQQQHIADRCGPKRQAQEHV
jgi:hypothetical protein